MFVMWSEYEMCVTTISLVYLDIYISGASNLVVFGCTRERAGILSGKMSLSSLPFPPPVCEKLPTLYRNPAVACRRSVCNFPYASE